MPGPNRPRRSIVVMKEIPEGGIDDLRGDFDVHSVEVTTPKQRRAGKRVFVGGVGDPLRLPPMPQFKKELPATKRRPSLPARLVVFARALGMSPRKAKQFLADRGLENVVEHGKPNRQLWTIDLDKTEVGYIKKIEAEINKDAQSGAN